ncbi:MAG: saccharopine dehydrogenase NADP-binding domain-containing protein [Woeseiaceae bacterium]
MNQEDRPREFDIILWCATGFTGALVARYLLRRYGTDKDLTWAIAARSQSKLDTLRAELGEDAANLPTIIADSFNPDSLQDMVRRANVVITTVGPYALYGSALVEACVENGTHYCDLAGEVQWIRKMIDEHHERATETGARIVHCCGFDSVPMDIGVWFLQQEAQRRFGDYCQSIRLLVKATKGTASGGTVASLINLIEESRKDKSIARVLVSPYSLNPEGERDGPDDRDQQNVVYDDAAQSWTAPFVMAAVNTKVVRRSHALLGYPYGKSFRYREAVMTGDGPVGWAKGVAMTAALGSLVVGASFSVTRKLLQKFVLPEPGEGPDEELQQKGFFNLAQIGVLPDGRLLRSRITGDQDPGYGSTSKMLSECAVCLAKDDIKVGGGVWTPASSMAEPLLKRLQDNAGLSFEIRD